MTHFIPADAPLNPTEGRAPAAPAAGPWTPARHIAEGVTKPTRLLELGTGEHGKTALLEFPGGWQRTIDLPTEADAWHPLFSELPQADVQRLRKLGDAVAEFSGADDYNTQENSLPKDNHSLWHRGGGPLPDPSSSGST